MNFITEILNYPDGKLLIVEIDEGVYKIDLERWSVEFITHEEFQNSVIDFKKTDYRQIVYSPHIIIEDLKEKPGFPGLKSYDCGSIIISESGKEKNIIFISIKREYLDWTNANIESYDNPDEITEICLSTEKPYRGEIYKSGELHKPFCNKMISVKLRSYNMIVLH